ncbi:MAG TPA: HD domain-containing protein [Solirubrobacteraceae bacterium]|nr:HD domain-containing protein [Solirubrobacteraceae bacterium]
MTSADALRLVRSALADRPAWLVGGAVRDLTLGRPVGDLDVVLDGDPEQAARAIARAARGTGGDGAACFALSERFGAWRVVGREGSWQVDIERLRGGSLQEDLALRDFTVNAVAEPLRGGAPLDPLGGLEDLHVGRLRLAGPGAFQDDPLRVLRLVRVAVELDLTPDADALLAARAQVERLVEVSPERVFVELRRIVASDRVLRGIEMLDEVGAAAVVLPELGAMRGVQQSRYHHRDVYGHTLEVLERAVELTAGDALDRSPARKESEGAKIGVAEMLGEDRAQVLAVLAEPLADEMTRGEALRWGALLHDAAKPATRAVRVWDRRVTFIGHDTLGADLARDVLGRLRASVRLREHVAGLVRHHLALGFLVHEPQPLARTTVFDYLRRCDPVGVDVTLLSVCDRLATRGAKATEAIEAHMALAQAMLGDALRWRNDGPPAPLVRGDELAAELGIAVGPRIGELLADLARAQYAGEVTTREQAVVFARHREPRARAG